MLADNEQKVRRIVDLLLPGLVAHLGRRFGVLWRAHGYDGDLVMHDGGIRLRVSRLEDKYEHDLLSTKEIMNDTYRDLFGQRVTWLLDSAAAFFEEIDAAATSV